MKSKTEETIAYLDNVPPLPVAVIKLIAVMDDPDSSVNEIVSTMETATCAKVLSVSNSAYYSRLRKVETIEHAIAVLGRNTIRDVVLGITVVKMFDKVHDDTAFNYKKFWHKSIVSTQLAMMFGKILQLPDLSKIYTIGLIHDIGEIVFFLYFKEDYKKMQSIINEENISQVEAEKKIFGLSHAEVGKLLAVKWNLPESLARIINYHNVPTKLKDDLDELMRGMIIHAADSLTNELLNSPEWEEIFEDEERLKHLFSNMISHVNTLMKDISSLTRNDTVHKDWTSIIQEELFVVSHSVKPTLESLLPGTKRQA